VIIYVFWQALYAQLLAATSNKLVIYFPTKTGEKKSLHQDVKILSAAG
jgi:hypothetical protein